MYNNINNPDCYHLHLTVFMDTSQLISGALKAIKGGDLEAARDMLKRTIKQDPASEAGWTLLGACLEEHQQKIYCFQKALEINPANETAQRLLGSLTSGIQTPPPSQKTTPASSFPEPQFDLAQEPSPTPRKSEPAPSFPDLPAELPREPAQDPRKPVPAPSFPEQPADLTRESDEVEKPGRKGNRLVFLAAFLLGLLSIGIPLWIRISSSSLPPDFIFKPAKALVAMTGGDTAPEEMWFPEWATITPTSLMDSPLTLPTPTPGLSSDAGFQDRFFYVKPLINKALVLMKAENYAEAILLWDQVLEIVPEYAYGYYSRAASYWVLGTKDQGALSQSQQYYELALADLEEARLLGPDQAVYSYQEYEISRSLASLEENRSIRMTWLDRALNALATGISKGHRVSEGNRAVAEVLVTLGRCDEALIYSRELEKAIGIPDEDSAGTYLLLSQSYLCLQEYDQALEYVDRAINLAPSEFSDLLRGVILMNKSEWEEALEILDTLIEERPHFYGERYILRGVIHYELGNLDQARLDLETGLANSPESIGPVSYLQALLAIDDGDGELALDHLQEAEAALYSYRLPRFYDHTVQLISELGGDLPSVGPEIEPTPKPTPISSISVLEYDLPPPGTDQFAFAPANYSGTGIYIQDPGRGIGKRFYPDEAIEISGAAALYLRLDTDHNPDSLALRAACVPNEGSWSPDNYPEGTVELLPSETEILDADGCIYDNGLIYIVIWNEGEEEILINNLAIRLIAIAPDGSEITYGYQ